MPNQERIEELVSEAAYASIDKLIKALDGANDHIVECILAAEKLNTALSKSVGIKDYELQIKNLEVANAKLTKALAEATAAQVKLDTVRKKSADDMERNVQREMAVREKNAAKNVKLTETERLAEIKLEQDRKKSFDKYESQVNKQNALDDKRAQVIAANSRPYTLLSNELEKQRKRAQDLAIVYGESSKQFQDAAKSVFELDNRLKAVDAVLGKNQRNVGNYKSGFNGLSNSINQITREFPAFTFSVQTGFLALSNNIPIFFDQIQQTRAEIARLRAEGQKVPGLFKQLASSIFSFGTVLSIAVTLFSVYGKEIGEFFGAIFKGTEALNKFTESQKKLNEAMSSSDVTKAVKNIAELRINIDLSKKGFLDKDKVLKQYNESIGKTTGEVKSLDEAEKEINKNSGNYIKVTLLKAAAQLALEEAAKTAFEAEKARERGRKGITRDGEGAQKNLTIGERLRDAFAQDANVTAELVKKGTERTVKQADERTKTFEQIAAKFQEDAAKISKASGFDFFGGDQDAKKVKSKIDTSSIDAEKARIAALRDAQKVIVDDEEKSLELRFAALLEYTKNVKQLDKLDSDEKIKKAKSDTGLIKQANAELNTANQKSDIEAADLKAKINKKANDNLRKLLEEGKKQLTQKERDEITILEAANNEKLANIELYRSQAAQGVADQYAEGIISKKQYEQQLLDIESQAAKDRIQVEIDGLKAIIEKEKDYLQFGIGTNQQLGADERKLSQLEISLSKLTTDAKIKDKEKVAEAAKRLKDTEIELGKEVLSFGVAMVDGMFTRRINAIQGEIDANEVKKNADIENVNNSVGTEQEKADKIAIINARAAAQQAVLEQQQRQEKVKQAKFDKAASIVSIIANTAVAVMKTYAEFGFPIGVPLAVAQGAIGALQIATVLATPIPQFEHGGTMKKTGLAMYGEVGTELMIDPSGQLSLTPDKPTIGQVSAGTQFISNKDLVRMMAKPELHPQLSNSVIDVSSIIKSQESSSQKVIKAIKGQKSSNTIITKRGWRNTQSKMGAIDSYLKRNFS